MPLITYLGFDETTLGTQNNSLIVVCAETSSPELVKDKGWNALKKAKDFLREAHAYESGNEIKDYGRIPRFPGLDDMPGLVDFRWMRCSIGHNTRQLIEHASIAHLIAFGGYNPENVNIYVDAFHGNANLSKYLIRKYLGEHEIMVPLKDIEIVPNGDKRIPIINYADLLAFQIGLSMNNQFGKYSSDSLNFPLEPREIDFNNRRVAKPLGEDEKKRLEQLVREFR